MTKFIKLLIFLLRSRFGLSGFSGSVRDSKERKKLISNSLILLFAVGYMSFIAVISSYGLFKAASSIGLQVLLIPFYLLSGMLVTFLFGINFSLTSFFFSRDSEFLSVLPIKQSSVFGVKFADIYISELAITSVIVMPVMITYGILSSAGIPYYIMLLIITAAMPLFPLLLASLASVLIVFTVGRMRRRELLVSVLSFGFIIVFLIGEQMLIPRLSDPESVTAIISGSSSVISAITTYFPPAGWAANSLANLLPTDFHPLTAILYLLLYLAVSAVVYSLLSIILSKVYTKYSTLFLESRKSGKKVNLSKTTGHSAFSAFYTHEWRSILRTPAYVMNCLSGIILGPIFVSFPLLQGTAGSLKDELRNIGEYGFYIIAGILAAIVIFIVSTNLLAATAITREAKNLWFFRTIPTRSRVIISAKFAVAISVNALMVIVTGFAAILFYGLPLLPSLTGIIFGFVFGIITASLSMLLDMKNPKLTWSNETEAVKQSMNGMLSLFGTIILASLLGGLLYLLFRSGIPLAGMTLITFAVFIAAAASCVAILLKSADKLKFPE